LALTRGMWLAATGAAQAGELAELGLDAILIIDEPGIAAAGLLVNETAVWDPPRAYNVRARPKSCTCSRPAAQPMRCSPRS
jgi:hypothetical protein